MKIYVAFNGNFYGEIVALGLSVSKKILEEEYDYMKDVLEIIEYEVDENNPCYIDFPRQIVINFTIFFSYKSLHNIFTVNCGRAHFHELKC